MGSFGLEILVNHQGDAARMQSNVLENLLGLLDTKCMDRYALPHSFESTDTEQESRKRKLSSFVEAESELECIHKAKRVRFAVNSKIRLVSEHSNSNDHRMSRDDVLIEENESSLSANPLPSENDADAISFPAGNAGDDESSDEDQDESDDNSLNEFAGFSESEDESEASEAGAQSTPAVRGEAVDDARSSSSECEQDRVHSSYGTEGDEHSFEDTEIHTKEEDGPSIATTVAQAVILELVERLQMSRAEVMATFRSALSAAVSAAPPRADGGSAGDGILGGVLERLRRLIERIDECGQAALLPSTLVIGAAFLPALRFLISTIEAADDDDDSDEEDDEDFGAVTTADGAWDSGESDDSQEEAGELDSAAKSSLGEAAAIAGCADTAVEPLSPAAAAAAAR
uniref:Uncharacterized protein n=1 Tax=Cryptomonas curvata TaxID=233186 RepID=A0A7S0QMF7_9CRYP|mmetsp:Transcript_36775/g.76794  ORF Transcript_36775/g.76794 Transcript_36775/m.76794 type:complete len:401 (+) Transcript_36775:111-1313(+)